MSGADRGWGVGLAVVTVVVLVTVVAATVVLSRDRPDDPARALAAAPADASPSPPTESPSSEPAPAPSRDTTPGTYRPVKKPCARIGTGDVEPVLGRARPNRDPMLNDRVGAGEFATIGCAIDFGGDAFARFQIELMDPIAAEAQFSGLRRAQGELTSVADVPDLGQAAYAYVDEQTGPHVVTFDGNLHLTVSFSRISGDAPAADDEIIAALTGLSEKMLRALARSGNP
jgi:hypothetical protein